MNIIKELKNLVRIFLTTVVLFIPALLVEYWLGGFESRDGCYTPWIAIYTFPIGLYLACIIESMFK